MHVTAGFPLHRLVHVLIEDFCIPLSVFPWRSFILAALLRFVENRESMLANLMKMRHELQKKKILIESDKR